MLSLLLCIFLHAFVGALRTDPVSIGPGSHLSLQARADTGSGIPLSNIADLSYYVQITLGGQTFSVLVDTGSSDLWVAGSVVASDDTGISSSIGYAAGDVNGSIKIGTLEFAGYTIPNQVFLEVKPDAINKAGSGIIGLGPTTGSFLYQDLQPLAGEAVLNHIFMQNLTTPNYFTILLGREQDIRHNPGGSLTVGEILNGYTDIENEQTLIMTDLSNHASDHHIRVLLDQDGIIISNGQRIPLTTEVSGTINKKQVTVLIDCGFSLPQVPQLVSDAIYSLYYGAEFINIPTLGAAWIVPCDQEINMTLIFGRKPYPIHPLDLTIEPGAFGLDNIINSQGKNSCIGTFQPFTYQRTNPISYDMILGMAFMRNVYVLFDYSSLVAGLAKPSSPHIKMMSVTNLSNAHLSFVDIRLGGIDTTGSQKLQGATIRQEARNFRTTLYVVASVCAVLLVVAAM